MLVWLIDWAGALFQALGLTLVLTSCAWLLGSGMGYRLGRALFHPRPLISRSARVFLAVFGRLPELFVVLCLSAVAVTVHRWTGFYSVHPVVLGFSIFGLGAIAATIVGNITPETTRRLVTTFATGSGLKIIGSPENFGRKTDLLSWRHFFRARRSVHFLALLETMKNSALLSVLSIGETTRFAGQMSVLTDSPFTLYGIAIGFYVLCGLCVRAGFRRWSGMVFVDLPLSEHTQHVASEIK